MSFALIITLPGAKVILHKVIKPELFGVAKTSKSGKIITIKDMNYYKGIMSLINSKNIPSIMICGPNQNYNILNNIGSIASNVHCCAAITIRKSNLLLIRNSW